MQKVSKTRKSDVLTKESFTITVFHAYYACHIQWLSPRSSDMIESKGNCFLLDVTRDTQQSIMSSKKKHWNFANNCLSRTT